MRHRLAIALACAGWAVLSVLPVKGQVNPAQGQGKPVPTLASDNAESKYVLTLQQVRLDTKSVGNPWAKVRETRKLGLKAGINDVRFADIPQWIDVESVRFAAITYPQATQLLEQSYAFDLGSPDDLLKKYVGRNIVINRKQEPLPGDRARMPDSIDAKLLAYTPEQFVLLTNNKQLPIQIIPRNQDITEIKLFDLPGGLSSRPSLAWKVQSPNAAEQDVQVSYRTQGLNWRSSYQVCFSRDGTQADLATWISIDNQSGVTFKDARIRLVDLEDAEMMLPRPMTLDSQSKRQTQITPGLSGLRVNRRIQVNALGEFDRPVDKRFEPKSSAVFNLTKVTQVIDMELPEAGIELPSGAAQIFQRKEEDDAAGELVTERAWVEHVSKSDRKVSLRQYFEKVKADRDESEFKIDQEKKTITEKVTLNIYSDLDKPQQVEVVEMLWRTKNAKLLSASVDAIQSDNGRAVWKVEIPAGGKSTITYTVQYGW